MTTPTIMTMTDDDQPEFGSTKRMSLERVSAQGSVDGLMLTMSLRQVYRNLTAQTLETVYTFPLAFDAVLLGVSAELAGRRLQGIVQTRQRAERDYEEAIASGDAPVLVQKSADSLYTANLGNLKPGEEMVIELRYAQLLHRVQDRVQVRLPLTIAPRYGSAAAAGIKVHEAVESSARVSYPFELELAVKGALALGELSSPSHRIAVVRTESGMRIRLAQDSWLDRDVVLDLQQPVGAPLPCEALLAPSANGSVVLASFSPPEMLPPRSAIDLKILVDCSGSMAGDSIVQARAALHDILGELGETDQFSYSKFGTSSEHEFKRLTTADTASLSRAAAAIDRTDADMGGTELANALEYTLSIRGARERADILLITDGDVWEIRSIVEDTLQSHHRIFAIGVGSAPAESLLRRLAEDTGGACELVAPNEAIRPAVLRMLKRIRSARTEKLTLAWGRKPAWVTQLPHSVFAGDTLHVFAGFNEPVHAVDATLSCEFVPERGVRDSIGPWAASGQTDSAASTQLRLTVHARAEHGAPASWALEELPRIAAWQRIQDAAQRIKQRTVTQEWALDLALEHQLVTPQTSLFLVHVRTTDEQTSGMPSLQRIEHMLAAGWGGMGSVLDNEGPREFTRACRMGPLLVDESTIGEWEAMRLQDASSPEESDLFTDAHEYQEPETSIDELLDNIEASMEDGDWPYDLSELWWGGREPDKVKTLLAELIARGLTPVQAHAVLLQAVINRFGQEGRPGKSQIRKIAEEVQTIPATRLQGLELLLEATFETATLQSW